MKYVLSGVALAALIAAGLPALAQNSTTRSTTPMPPATTAAPTGNSGQSSSMPSGGQSMDNQSSGMSSSSSSNGGSGVGNAQGARHENSPQDNMAEQLNHEELQRVTNGSGGQSGSTMPPGGSMQNGSTMPSGPANARPGSGPPPSNMTSPNSTGSSTGSH